MQATALAAALGTVPAVLAGTSPDAIAEAAREALPIEAAPPGAPRGAAADDAGTLTLPHDDEPAPTAEQQAVIGARVSDLRLAQFQLPPKAPAAKPEAPGAGAPAVPADGGLDASVGRPRTLTQQLTYQYGYGSESSVTYRRDSDLDRSVRDNLLLLSPQINGFFLYRPVDWLEATLEVIAEVDIPSQQPETVALPNGQFQPDLPTKSSLVADQAYLLVRRITAPFEFSVGRRNYEDERHWLYDSSLDTGGVTIRQGAFRVDAFAGREVWKSLNLIPNQGQTKDRINTAVVYVDYRGIEDMRFAVYQIKRDDLTRENGRPRNTGVRAIGRPSDELNFWAEAAYTGGRDSAGQKLSGTGYDFGATYRFLNLPLRPNVTLGYAFGSGDDNPNDSTNHTFLQTGLQSNEARFAGVSKFKYYGEALDPELSNLKILTVGLGFWPAPNVTVDLVYHRYRLQKVAEDLAAPITAQMNQVETLVPAADPNEPPIPLPQVSRAVGQGFDVVIGVRRLFGLQRLGMDLRFGWFFPGDAYDRNVGTDENPLIRRADKAFNLVAKFWW
jgi:alginate production protein